MQRFSAQFEHSADFDLLSYFEEFLAAWNELKLELENHINHQKPLTYANGDEVENVAKFVQSLLLEFAERQTEHTENVASAVQLRLYRQQQYAIAALIDEQILANSSWKLDKNWLPLMMEYSLFRSRNAGDSLIEEIQKLSEQTQFSADERALAGCYLRTLWLGFDGKFKNDRKQLTLLGEKLAMNAQLTQFNLVNRNICEQAYKYNNNPIKQSRLAPISRWKRYGIIAFFSYIIVSFGVWIGATYAIHSAIDCAEQISQTKTQTDSEAANGSKQCR